MVLFHQPVTVLFCAERQGNLADCALHTYSDLPNNGFVVHEGHAPIGMLQECTSAMRLAADCRNARVQCALQLAAAVPV